MGCPLLGRCAYPALFATPAPVLPKLTLRTFGVRDQAPRPLVLAPEPGWTRPSGHYRRLAAGSEIPFRVTLIGKAIDDLALLVVALRKMANYGIGRSQGASGRAAAELVRVTTVDGCETIFEQATDLFQTPVGRLPDANPPSLNDGDRIKIRLISPLRLKRERRIKGKPSPVDFMVTLARRANTLAALFGNGALVADEREIETMAAGIESEETETRLVHVRRYSARQNAKMEWPGVIGTLVWRGSILQELWPLLRFGELVQLGKGATLGFGRYVLHADDSE